jgi:phage gp46-like protein
MTEVKRTFQGDPRLILGADGATIKFVGGQPVMDGGLENYVLIALFTKPGWVGNIFFDDPLQKIGSDFEEVSSRAITLTSLNDTEEATERALEDMKTSGLAESIIVEASNPSGDQLKLLITITRPNQDAQELTLTRNNLNWQMQISDPAHKKI